MRWLRPFLNGEDIIKEINRVTYEIYLIDYLLLGNKNGIDVAIEILNNFPFSSYTIYYCPPIKLDKTECTIVSLVNKN